MTTDNKTLADALTRFRCAGYDPTDGSGPIMVADPEGPWVLAADVIGTGSDCEATPASPDAPESGGDWFGDVLGSIGTVIPLADVQPGGRVRLGDQAERARFEAWHCEKFKTSWQTGAPTRDMHNGVYADNYGPAEEQVRWEAWQAALSAQPSPGGQDVIVSDEMVQAFKAALARAQLPGKNRTYFLKDSELPSILREVLAARQPSKQPDSVALGEATEFCVEKGAMQPMGEPVAYTSETQLKAVRLCGDGIMSQRNAKWDIPLYLQPEQAVDLPYSLDADPAGIRARVADVITGTLMVGAQGHTPPPTGHWAEPFWQAALADAALQVKMREALWAAAGSLRTIADSTKETEFLETAHEIRAYANSRANCAEQALKGSQAVQS